MTLAQTVRNTATNIMTGLFMTILLLVGCADEGTNPSLPVARLRVIHMASDGQAVDVKIDNTVLDTSVAYGTTAPYKTVSPGSRVVAISPVGSAVNLIQTTVDFEDNADYTVIAFPPAASLSAQLVRDDRTLVPTGQARVRFVNAAGEGNTLELRRRGTSTPWPSSVAAGRAGAQQLVESGEITFELFSKVLNRTVATFEPTTFTNASYTVVLHGSADDVDTYPLRLSVISDGGDGTTTKTLGALSTTARVRAVHTLADNITVAFTINDTVRVQSLQRNSASALFTVDTVPQRLGITSGATTILTTQLSPEPGKTYSLFATGTVNPQNVAPLLLEDVTVANPQAPLVRFINLVPDAPEVDVITPFPGLTDPYTIPGMQKIAFREASVSAANGTNFLIFAVPGGVTRFEFRFRESGTTNILFSQNNIVLEPGGIYTVFISGRRVNSTMTATVLRHN